MTDLEFARWTTKVAADAMLAATLVDAAPGSRFLPVAEGSLDAALSADLSWVESATRLEPYSFLAFEILDRDSPRSRASTAIHEAGHMVINEQVLEAGTSTAVALSLGGRSGLSWHPKTRYRAELIALLDKRLLAAAGSYAGRLAELMAAGQRWTKPVLDVGTDDFKHGHDVLMEISQGDSLLPLMASSQQLALRVLQQCWPRVIEIAEQLLAHESYAAEIKAENQINPSALTGSGAGGAAGD